MNRRQPDIGLRPYNCTGSGQVVDVFLLFVKKSPSSLTSTFKAGPSSKDMAMALLSISSSVSS